jgi:Zn-finger protein
MAQQITSETFAQAREALRNGIPAFFVCIKSRKDFTCGGIYPIERFDGDCNLYLSDDRGDGNRFMADGRSSNSCKDFLYTESKDDAEEIQRDLRAKHAAWLEQCGKAFLTVQPEFKVGQLIMWKPDLKDKVFPQYGEPAVVLSAFMEPAVDSEVDTSSQYSCAINDMIIGVRAPDGDFTHYYADSRRWQPFQQ